MTLKYARQCLQYYNKAGNGFLQLKKVTVTTVPQMTATSTHKQISGSESKLAGISPTRYMYASPTKTVIKKFHDATMQLYHILNHSHHILQFFKKIYNTIVIILNNVKPNGIPLHSKKNFVACHIF